MCPTDTRDHSKMIRVFVRGLRGELVNVRCATTYTGSYTKCPHCSVNVLGALLIEHLSVACPWQGESKEVVVIVAGGGEPEPHWEKD